MVISLSLPWRDKGLFLTFLKHHWWPWVRWGLSHQKRELKHSAPSMWSGLSCKACFAGSFWEGSVHHSLLEEGPQHASLARSFRSSCSLRSHIPTFSSPFFFFFSWVFQSWNHNSLWSNLWYCCLSIIIWMMLMHSLIKASKRFKMQGPKCMPLIPALGRQRQVDFWVCGQPGLQYEF
jgi:hypothetical protein